MSDRQRKDTTLDKFVRIFTLPSGEHVAAGAFHKRANADQFGDSLNLQKLAIDRGPLRFETPAALERQLRDSGALAADVDPDEAHCRVCRCTENRPCIGGCAWASDEEQIAVGLDPMSGDLCTACLFTDPTAEHPERGRILAAVDAARDTVVENARRRQAELAAAVDAARQDPHQPPTTTPTGRLTTTAAVASSLMASLLGVIDQRSVDTAQSIVDVQFVIGALCRAIRTGEPVDFQGRALPSWLSSAVAAELATVQPGGAE